MGSGEEIAKKGYHWYYVVQYYFIDWSLFCDIVKITICIRMMAFHANMIFY